MVSSLSEHHQTSISLLQVLLKTQFSFEDFVLETNYCMVPLGSQMAAFSGQYTLSAVVCSALKPTCSSFAPIFVQILVQIFGGFPLLPQMCTNINLGSGQYFLYNFVGFLFLPQLCANLNVCFGPDFLNNFSLQAFWPNPR